jgi:phosphate transport system permease protein
MTAPIGRPLVTQGAQDPGTGRQASQPTPSTSPGLSVPTQSGTSEHREFGQPALTEHGVAEHDKPIVGSAAPLPGGDLIDGGPPVSGSGSFGAGKGGKVRIGDRVFGLLTSGAGLFIILLVTLVAVFLVSKAIPAIRADKVNFLFSRKWNVDGDVLQFGILNLLWVTVFASFVAMLIALPIAVGVALFITFYAPRRMARPVAYVIDLLAAIPSIVYGIWGIYVLAPRLGPVRSGIENAIGWIPFFKKTAVTTGTIFVGSIVLAIMILPIITAISREVFERTPRTNIEAAWALGATRWEMVRLSVLPYGRPGVISGAMLGLGRALGETIAITLILSKPGDGSPFSFSIFNGGETFASKIANNAAEFTNPKQTGAYIAAGLVLFILTFAVNAAARYVISRRKDFV